MNSLNEPPEDDSRDATTGARASRWKAAGRYLKRTTITLAFGALLISTLFSLDVISWDAFGDQMLWQETLPALLPPASFLLISGLTLQYLIISILAGRKGFRGLISRLGLLVGGFILTFAIVLLLNLDWQPDVLQASFIIDGEVIIAKLLTLLTAVFFSLATVGISFARRPRYLGKRLNTLSMAALATALFLAALLFQITVSDVGREPGWLETWGNGLLNITLGSYLLLSVIEVFVGDFHTIKNSLPTGNWPIQATLFTVLHTAVLLVGFGYGLSLALVGRDLATLQGSTTILDSSGTQLQVTSIGQYPNNYRFKVALKQMPDALIDATVAVEDHSFFSQYHRPVDPVRLAVSALGSAEQLTSAGSVNRVEGGSTITQQAIKMHSGRPISTTAANLTGWLPGLISRPFGMLTVLLDKVIIEIPGACVLEALWSNEAILEYYLNGVYLGDGVWGVETAAQNYFGKTVDQLTPAEATLLAGLPQAPSYLDPRVNLTAAYARQSIVLDAMVDGGFLTEDEAIDIEITPVTIAAKPNWGPSATPHFTLVAQEQLARLIGDRAAQQGGTVITTLDYSMQQVADGLIKNGVATFADRQANNAALLAIDHSTGQVKAMVGSAKAWNDPVDGQYNMTLAERPAASTFKLFVYIAAYENGYQPESIINDVQREIAGQYIVNWDGLDLGKISLREAFAQSRNPPAVELTEHLGLRTVADVARRLGITSELHENELGPILGLGACSVRMLDLATAYATVANQGVQHEPVFILAAENWQGKTIYQHEQTDGKRLISADVVDAINASLQTMPREDGFRQLMGAKTGTTDNYTDAWLAGYGGGLTVVTWMGHTAQGVGLQPMDGVWGYDGAGAIWRGFMAWHCQEAPNPGVPIVWAN